MSALAGHTKLTTDQVLEIFSLRPARNHDHQTYIPSKSISQTLSTRFSIGERSIRDIWNRRSWRDVTRPMWTIAEVAADPAASALVEPSLLARVIPVQTRKPGRPCKTTQDDKDVLGLDSMQVVHTTTTPSLIDHLVPDPKLDLFSVDDFNTRGNTSIGDGNGFVIVPMRISVSGANDNRDVSTQCDTNNECRSLGESRVSDNLALPNDLYHQRESDSGISQQPWQLSAEILHSMDPFEEDWKDTLKALENSEQSWQISAEILPSLDPFKEDWKDTLKALENSDCNCDNLAMPNGSYPQYEPSSPISQQAWQIIAEIHVAGSTGRPLLSGMREISPMDTST